ncbi:MAG: hypothetical protein RLZ98_3018 [Pseudomonadota bacterium]
MTQIRPAVSVFAIAAIVAIALLDDVKVQTAALIMLAILMWATMAIPEYLTSLIFIALSLVIGLAPANVVLSGFQAKAVWLVFAGIVIGVAMQQHNLGASLFQRLGLHELSYERLVVAVALFSLALAFVLPSAVGRVLVLAPLVRILADRLHLAEASNERYGLYLTAVIGTTLPAFAILTSNVPNMVLLGTIETVLGITLTYPQYFLVNFPILGVGTFLLTTTTILIAFPGRLPQPSAAQEEISDTTSEQRRLAIILLATLFLWMTEELHHIPAAWVGLAMALLILAPGVGVLEPQAITRLNLGPFFFLAGVIAVGATARENGVAAVLWTAFDSTIPLDSMSNFSRYLVLFAFNMVLGVLTTLPAAPSIFVPLIPSITEQVGWSEHALALATVPSFVFFAFPYQAPPLLIGTSILGVPPRIAMRVLVPVWLTGTLVLAPLHYFWGRMLGAFP